MRFPFAILAVLCFAAPLVRGADAPTSRPANIDDALWQRMLAIDAKAGNVHDLTTDFEQQKFTALLKKPLTSLGTVRVKGGTMLWDTVKPEPTQLRIDAREVRIYYPQQKTIEVYAIQQKLGQLAASPLPRLAALLEHFTFSPLPLKEMGETDDTKFLALSMTPSQPELREHVEEVRVLLDARAGLILRLEMRDADGERTRITFSNAKPNTGLSDADLDIRAPKDVKVTRPLAAIEGSAK
jgi:outer membrane lipoprotein-sorting protein